MRILAGCCDLIPGDLGICAAELNRREGETRCRVARSNLTVDGEGVVEIVRQIAVLESDLDGPGLHFLAVIVISLLVVAADDFDLPARFQHGLGGNEAFGQLDLHLVGRLALATMRHLQCGGDVRADLGRRICEGRMGEYG